MKIRLFSLFLILLAAAGLSSCFDQPDTKIPLYINADSAVRTDLEGVYMTLDSLGESSISVLWHNKTDGEITFGEDYFVEMLGEGGAWSSVQKEEMSIPAIALMLPAGKELKKSYSFKSFDLTNVGRYRLRCEFWQDGKTYNTWIEFAVADVKAEQVNRIPDSDLSGFSDFLDREGFVKSMSQGQLMALADKYSEGLDPSIVPVFVHYDGIHGGGCTASGEFFGYTNDYYADDDTGKARYTNSIYAAVEIESLVLPYGIEYGDGIGDVLEKLAINRDIYKNTAAYDGTKMVLYDDGATSLVLANYFLTTEPVDFLYDIEITFTEKIDTLTRTVKLSFSDSTKELARVEIKTVDERNLAVGES